MVESKYVRRLVVCASAWVLGFGFALAQAQDKSAADVAVDTASAQLKQVAEALAVQQVQIARLKAKKAGGDELQAISFQLMADWRLIGQHEKEIAELNKQIAEQSKAPAAAPPQKGPSK